MANDNIIESRGWGEWVISTYSPDKQFGPYPGFLRVSRDFHVIYASQDNTTECIASFPSPNVAAAENFKYSKAK